MYHITLTCNQAMSIKLEGSYITGKTTVVYAQTEEIKNVTFDYT